MKAIRKKKNTKLGILGAPIENSSDDEEYCPPAEVSGRGSKSLKAPTNTKKKRKARRTEEDADLDVPFSIRRKNMIRPNAHASSSSRANGQGTTRSSRSSAARLKRLMDDPAAGSETGDWGSLPTDVLAVIFRAACRRNAIPTADRVASVCSVWRAAAYSAPDLWQRVDFSSGRYCRQDCPPPLAMAAPHWSQVEEVTLDGWNNGGLPILQALSESCPNVTSFTLTTSAAAREVDLKSAFSQWPHLKSVALVNVLVRPRTDSIIRMLIDPPSSSLTSPPDSPSAPGDIVVVPSEVEAVPAPPPAPAPAAEPSASGSSLPAAAAVLPETQAARSWRLEHLILRGCRDVSPALLKALAPPRRLCPSPGSGPLGALRQLDLTYSGQMGGTFVLHIERLQWACPLLEMLRLRGLGFFTWEGGTPGKEFTDGSPGFPCLREVSVASKWQMGQQDTQIRSNVDDVLLGRICGKSPLLKELDVTGCRRVSIEALHGLPCKLTSLNVTKTPLATDEGLGVVARLYADTLEELSASSAGGWITSKGVSALSACQRLCHLDIPSSGVDEAGLKALLLSAKTRDGSSRLLHLDLTGCRSLGLPTRKAANEGGIPALMRCLKV